MIGQVQSAYKADNKKLEDQIENDNKTYQQLQQQLDNLQNEYKSRQEELDQKLRNLESRKQTNIRLAVQSNRSGTVQRVGSRCEPYRNLISQYPWNVEIALAVCDAESGGVATSNHVDDNHGSCLGSRGLFQIGCDSTANFSAMFDPAANVAQAYSLYARRGWQPWSVCYNGRVSCI